MLKVYPLVKKSPLKLVKFVDPQRVLTFVSDVVPSEGKLVSARHRSGCVVEGCFTSDEEW